MQVALQRSQVEKGRGRSPAKLLLSPPQPEATSPCMPLDTPGEPVKQPEGQDVSETHLQTPHSPQHGETHIRHQKMHSETLQTSTSILWAQQKLLEFWGSRLIAGSSYSPWDHKGVRRDLVTKQQQQHHWLALGTQRSLFFIHSFLLLNNKVRSGEDFRILPFLLIVKSKKSQTIWLKSQICQNKHLLYGNHLQTLSEPHFSYLKMGDK